MKGGDIAAAVEKTGATGRARVTLETAADMGGMLDSKEMREPPPARRRTLKALANRMWDKAFRFGIRQAMRSHSDVRRAEGFLEFESRRAAIDHGAYAVIEDGSQRWNGRSGRPVAKLSEEPSHGVGPVWLFDLLHGVTDVSAARPGPTWLPPGAAFEELGAIPLEVWVDEEGLVRRIRFEQGMTSWAMQIHSLELFDFGTTAAVDWSRLPVFVDYRTGEYTGPGG